MMSEESRFDWTGLREAAREAASFAYAPYSGLSVGAAGLTTTGEIVSGCNVENASYGLTLCAECGLVSALRRAGHSELAAVAVTDAHGRCLTPCGRCRQLLFAHGGPGLLIDASPEPLPIGELLPGAFNEMDLPSGPGPTGQEGA